MKVLNIILCVLILLLAAVSAVSSYFLFAKRSQMVDGWSRMATAINRAATEMDKGSGTQVANELSESSLAHANYEKLNTLLPKLQEQATQLVAERNALADAVRRAGMIVDMNNLPSQEAFRNIATYNASQNEVLNGVTDFKNRRDRMIANLCNSGNKLGVKLNAAELGKANSDAVFRQFDAKVDAIRAQFSAYQSNARAVASITGAGSPNFNDQAYAASLAKITDSVRDLKKKHNEALALAESYKRQLASSQNLVKSKDGQIVTLNSKVSGKETEISQYRLALGLDPQAAFTPWANGSAECREHLRGKVIEVNNKFGFIAINLGKDTVVKQPIGQKTLDINPELASGMTLVVARNMDAANVTYIGKVKLTTVDGDCSIAEATELAPDQKIEVGDTVFFEGSSAAKAAVK